MNNKEIKFRIWDRQQRKFHTDADWGISLRGNHIIGFSSHDSWNDDRGYKINLSNQDNLIVQQYTGLKDRNDKEIYEGDVVIIYTTDTETGECHSSIFEVYFDQSFCQFKIKTHSGCYTMSSVNTYGEVIGNIFENPELLKQ